MNTPAIGNAFDYSRNVAWCPEYEALNSGLRENAFCLEDNVRNFEGLFSSLHTNILNQIDLLPRIQQVISKYPYHVKAYFQNIQLNPNISKWKIVGIYHGNINQGGSDGVAQWYGQSFKTTAGGSFCSASKTIQWSCGTIPPGQGWNNVGGSCYQRNSNVAC